MTRAALFLTLVVAWFVAGCGPPEVDPAYEALVEQTRDVVVLGDLGPDDKFTLRVLGEQALSDEFTVSHDGTINYPYLGRISVAGKTCAEVERQIADGLRGAYLQNPNVRCSVIEYNSKRVYVFGEVREPGTFPYRAGLTVVEAIAEAGGFAERAQQNETRLTRKVEGVQIQVRVPLLEIVEGRRENLKLLPGDIVFVPESPY